MKNIKFEINKEGKLIVEMDIKKNFGLSKSGKTLQVATTQGNVPLGTGDLSLGVNLYRPNPEYKKTGV